ncbi:hypothetical protein [Acinetobacter guillouiae]|uniref:hypothetical protein n=1 Tax=Acinetobacter guillouiae TaxID=106649 RepID=UPI0028CFF159|nr:hypothetical protein [Acinetobacter guillouiae]
MNEQKNVCGCACSALLVKLVEMNNQVMQQSNKLIEQNSQLIQINNEQNAQINELLIQLEGGDEDEQPKSQYLDG